ncbi:MAG: serine protease family protein [Planctomycetota bacterium]|jgi:hypothetical protein
MSSKRLTAGAALMAAALLAWAPARGAEDALKKTARGLLEKHKNAVVLVEVVLKMKISRGTQSRDIERKMEVNGTVIRADGLTVIANSSIDPAAAYRRMGLKVDTSTAGVKIITADDTEHEARVALTDKDLDLAFVLPEAKVELPHVALGKAAAPGLLDSMIALTRMGRKANRQPGVGLSTVQSVVQKPRVRYIPAGMAYLACPVFNSSGEVLGLALRWPEANTVTVLPCEDILEVAAQVKAGEKKPDDGDAAKKAPVPEEKPLDPLGL